MFPLFRFRSQIRLVTDAGERFKPLFAAELAEYGPALRQGRARIVCAVQH